jgi:hypothetical protein
MNFSNCKNHNLIISTAIAFDPATDTLNITLPNGGFRNCENVNLLIAQEIPAATTLTALVNIIIEGSTFPLTKINGLQVTASEILTGVVYPTKVITNGVTGTFKLIVDPKCLNRCSMRLLPIEPVADGGGA